jgi:hypothetical protein
MRAIIFTPTQNFNFLDSKLENKRFCTKWWQAFPDFNLLLISSRTEFWYIKAVPKYLKHFHPLRGTIIYLYTVTLSCILISRHDHILSFLSICF